MNNYPGIPFLDLVAPHQELRDELQEVFRNSIETGAFIGGPVVERFEQKFASFCGAEYSVGVGSGTDALRFALIAAGIRPGEVVVTVPNTFIATAEAISQAGGVPEFVDVDEKTCNMDPCRLEEYFERECYFDGSIGRMKHRATERVVGAIVPVHLYGQMADMDRILAIAERYKVIVIEDACQAHGAEYFSKKDDRWYRAGSMGKAAAFSFYPGKNLGACGEAGAVTTNDLGIARQIRMIRDHGQAQKYYHDIEGYNGRLDAIQAGILEVKLARLAAWNESRRQRASFYDSLFAEEESEIIRVEQPTWSSPVYHLYVIRTSDRDGLAKHLKDHGIATGIHYPLPLHFQKPYIALGYGRGSFPVSERLASEILSLPMYPQLTNEAQRYIVKQTLAFTQEARPPQETVQMLRAAKG